MKNYVIGFKTILCDCESGDYYHDYDCGYAGGCDDYDGRDRENFKD